MTKHAQTEHEVGELSGRVSELELLVHGNKKPWYKDTGLWISILAVVFSIYTGIHEIAHQSAEDLKAKRSEVLQNISDLISTDIQFLEEAKKAGKDELDYSNDGLDTKFRILLSRIDVIDGEIPGQLSREEYSFIADAYREHGGSLTKSIAYYGHALTVTTDWADSFYTCEKIGTAYFAGSEDVREIDAGDRYLFQALQSIHKNKWDASHGAIDGFQLKLQTDVFSLLAQLHAQIGDSAFAFRYLDSARRYVNAIPLHSGWRPEAVEVYNEHINDLNNELRLHVDTLTQ